MKLIFLLGFALFSLAQASPIPSDVLEGATIIKSYTLPDGTRVQEMRENDNGNIITIRIFNRDQMMKINEELVALPNTRIMKNPPGLSDVLSIPANELYSYLIRKGFEFPEVPRAPFFAENPKRIVSIYITQLYKLLANVDQLKNVPVPVAVKLLKTKATLQVEMPPSAEKKLCKDGLIATARKVANGAVTGILGDVADLFGSGLFGGLARGAKDVIHDAHKTVTDIACGLEDIADLGVGHVIHLVRETRQAVGEVVSAVENAADEAYNNAVKGLRTGTKELLNGIADLL